MCSCPRGMRRSIAGAAGIDQPRGELVAQEPGRADGPRSRLGGPPLLPAKAAAHGAAPLVTARDEQQAYAGMRSAPSPVLELWRSSCLSRRGTRVLPPHEEQKRSVTLLLLERGSDPARGPPRRTTCASRWK